MHWIIVLGSLALALSACGASNSDSPASGGGGGTDGGGTGGGGTGGAAGTDAGIEYCAGYVDHGGTPCRTDSDCPGTPAGMTCHKWDQGTGCPYPPQCSGDSSCGDGKVCVDDGCYVACAPKCTATSCSADKVCGADGHCQPAPCSGGYDCGPDAVCEQSSPNADAHGCRPKSCSSEGYQCPPNSRCDQATPDGHGCTVLACAGDSDCDCGVCFKGACTAGPGYCAGLPQ